MDIRCVGVSAKGKSTSKSLRTERRKVPDRPVSSAVMQTSPSPCTPWPSPAMNSAPSLNTGKYSVVPGFNSLLSMLPPKARGTAEPQRPQALGGATPMMPKNGSSGSSVPQGSVQTLRARSIAGWMVS